MSQDIKKSAVAVLLLMSSFNAVVNAQEIPADTVNVNNLSLDKINKLVIPKADDAQQNDNYPKYGKQLSEKVTSILQKKSAEVPIAVEVRLNPSLSKAFIDALKSNPKNKVQAQVESTLYLVTDAQTLDSLSKNAAIEFADLQATLKAQQSLATHEVALGMLEKLATKAEKNQNIVVSPWGISETTAAVLLANSDPNNIELPHWFKQNMSNQAWLSAYNQTQLSANVKRYNYIFADQSLTIANKFKSDYNSNMSGKINSVDFIKNQTQEINKINQQIAKDSNGLIKQLLPSNLPPLKLMLTNVLHFKSTWQSKFDKKASYPSDFVQGDNKISKVTYMRKDISADIAQVDDWTLVSLPFKDGQELDLLLPPSKAPLAFPSVEQFTKLKQAITKTDATIHLPKINLKGDVVSLETDVIPEITTWTMNAIVEGQNIKIDKALHQAVVTWDEQGAEAAAATAFIVKRSISERKLDVKFNRPFVFMIRQKDTILFTGQVRRLTKN